jgi:hypothetical protein
LHFCAVFKERMMSHDAPADHITKKRVLFDMPGTDAVAIRSDLAFTAADRGLLTMDLYTPSRSTGGSPLPAVVVVVGYPDTGTRLGCKFKEMAWSVGWGRLIAASGLAAVTYTNRAPVADLGALLDHLQRAAASLGIDRNRIGLCAVSGHVPLALSLLMEASRRIRVALLSYGYMLDSMGSTTVADASTTFGFVNPCSGRSVADVPDDVRLFVARAGRDDAGLNGTIDRFVAAALARNLSLTLMNHADGPHAFDLFHDSETTREIIRQGLAFLRFNLVPGVAC